MNDIHLDITITPEAVREIFRLLGIKEKEERNEEEEKVIKEEEDNKEEKENIYIRDSVEVEKASKPTREEVLDYIVTNNLYMDGNKFFNYYESVGWKAKNGDPIADWRAACRGAAKRAYDSEERKRLGNPQVSATEVKEKIKALDKEEAENRKRYPDELPKIRIPKRVN